MTKFVDIFKKEFLFEDTNKKTGKKEVKIFYKFDVSLVKKSEEQEAPNNAVDQSAQQAAPAPAAMDLQNQPIDMTQTLSPTPEQPVQQAMPAQPGDNPIDFSSLPQADTLQASVVTEDDKEDDVEITDDNNVVRKFEGDITVSEDQVDQIQSIEDIINILQEEKKNGVPILDEFTAGVVFASISPMANEFVNKIDNKKSSMFIDILYGFKKEDSVGVRIIKRKNNEMTSTNILVDNELKNIKYNQQMMDKLITDFRNDYINPGKN